MTATPAAVRTVSRTGHSQAGSMWACPAALTRCARRPWDRQRRAQRLPGRVRRTGTSRGPGVIHREQAQSLADASRERRDDPAYDVCPHAMSDHDAIGLRFCRATLNGAITRGCICRSS